MRRPRFAIALTLGLASMLLASTAAQADKLTYIGQMKEVRASYEDTLIHIARANNMGFLDMRAANPKLDPWIPGEGAKVILPTMMLLPSEAPQNGIVINLPEMRLYYYQKPGQAPMTYSIGIGREGLSTPTGSTSILNKVAGPTWRPTPRMRKEDPTLPAVVEPGPENPLGSHALYLGFPEIRIHGTNKPYGIGRRLSSGCIRMYPEGIVELYKRVPVGTKVTVVDQPVKVAWIGNNIYMEAHPTQKDALVIERDGGMPSYDMTDKDMQDILGTAGPGMEENLDWVKIRQVIKERRGYPVLIGRRPGTNDPDASQPVSIRSTGEKGVPADVMRDAKSTTPATPNAPANKTGPVHAPLNSSAAIPATTSPATAGKTEAVKAEAPAVTQKAETPKAPAVNS
jgi:L,D-transpeptidase ErfK/SrfK